MRSRWENDKFVISTRLDRDEIVKFFHEKYVPTPLISPWNGGSGFMDPDVSDIERIEESGEERMRGYAEVIAKAKGILGDVVPEYRSIAECQREFRQPGGSKGAKAKGIKDRIKDVKKAVGSNKEIVMRRLRNEMPDSLVPWFDAAFVTGTERISFGTVLGTGANDGNFEITDNFAHYVCMCILEEKERDWSKNALRGSLFDTGAGMRDVSNAFFHPGGYLGPNASSTPGFKTGNLTNPWDFILGMEGTLFFAGSVSRRTSSRRAAFPFTVISTHAGYGTATSENARGEIWMPLWDSPASYREMRYVFREGRAQLGTTQSTIGVEFVRALASLGTERGLSGFQRFAILERKGLAYVASDAGRIRPDPSNAVNVNLLAELDPWLDRIRSGEMPNRVKALLSKIDGATIRYCTSRNAAHLQDVLIAASEIEYAVSLSRMAEDIRPMPEISQEWIDACHDGSVEFRLAAALATMTDREDRFRRPEAKVRTDRAGALPPNTPPDRAPPEGEQRARGPGVRGIYPIRHNMMPVKAAKSGTEWAPRSPKFLWNGNDPIKSMIKVLERRCLDARMANVPLALKSPLPASITDVLQFIEDGDRLDLGKIGRLAQAMSAVEKVRSKDVKYHNSNVLGEIPSHVPEQYICIKTNFPPHWYKEYGAIRRRSAHEGKAGPKVGEGDDQDSMKFEPSMLHLLKAGRIEAAADIARRRLRITGINLATYAGGTASGGDAHMNARQRSRFAASMLFPVRYSDLGKVVDRIRLRSDEDYE